jgi:hypothetical protein
LGQTEGCPDNLVTANGFSADNPMEEQLFALKLPSYLEVGDPATTNLFS